jgi:hypothetical protein
MKCIHCGRISRRRERTGGRCPECRHRFAFDPAARPGAGTDAEFQEAIDRVSGGGHLRFTTRQLWLAANVPRKIPPPPRPGKGPTVAFALAFALPLSAVVLLAGMPGLLIVAVLGGLAGVAIGRVAASDEMLKYARRLAPRGPFDTFLRYQLAPWLQVHGDIPGLLPPRGTDAAAEPPRVPANVAAFAVDNVVVTDRWETAQMLVANRFHVGHDCAVLSLDGYPDGIAGTIKEMLRRNPRLTVFALHDAGVDGCQLPLELRAPEWFPDPSVRVVDLGLRPETVRRLNLPPIPGPPAESWTLPARLSELLSYDDREWLAAGNEYELSAFTPEQVMRGAYRGIVAAGPGDGSGRDPAYDGAHWTGVAPWFGAPPVVVGGADTAEVAARMSLHHRPMYPVE